MPFGVAMTMAKGSIFSSANMMRGVHNANLGALDAHLDGELPAREGAQVKSSTSTTW